MSFFDAFFGSIQSQFTAYAILAAVISICISIILTGTDMTIGNRFLLIFFVILAIIPSVFLMLLQITCMVTGGNKNDRWWCWLYSWVIAIFVIIYCIFVVIISLTSLFTYNNAISKVDMSEQNNKMSPESSNNYAKMMINTNTKEEIEKFMNQEEDEAKQSQVSTDNSFIQEFSNPENQITSTPPQSSMPPTPPPQSSIPSIPSSLSSTPPLETSTPPPQSSTPPPQKDTFNSKEVIEDDVEPFTNFSYSYL